MVNSAERFHMMSQIMCLWTLVPFWWVEECLVVGCSNQSSQNKGASFYQIPKMVYGKKPERKIE